MNDLWKYEWSVNYVSYEYGIIVIPFMLVVTLMHSHVG